MKLPKISVNLILSLSIFIASFASAQDLPNLGEPAQADFSLSQQKALGKRFMRALNHTGRVIHDPIDTTYINNLGAQLVAASGNNPGFDFHFFFINDEQINAFAGPGGYVAVHSGLILAAENESELAAVLAHEVTHVTQGHLARSIKNAKKVRAMSMAGMLAAIALGSQSGEAAGGALAATIAGAQQNMINFTRANEQEADRIGMDTLVKTGFDPSALPRFFNRLKEQERYYGKYPAILQDHPLTSERIADAQNRLMSIPTKSSYKNSLSFYLVRERLRVQTAQYPKKLVREYQKKLKSHDYQNKVGLQYGYALALSRAHQNQQALEILQSLVKTNPDNLILHMGIAQVLKAENKYQQAVDYLKPFYQLYPDNYALIISYAHSLLLAGHPKQAVKVLKKNQLDYPKDPIPYDLLSRAQAKAGMTIPAYETRAQYFEDNDEFKAAIGQLKSALAVKNIDSQSKERINAKIKALNQEAQKK